MRAAWAYRSASLEAERRGDSPRRQDLQWCLTYRASFAIVRVATMGDGLRPGVGKAGGQQVCLAVRDLEQPESNRRKLLIWRGMRAIPTYRQTPCGREIRKAGERVALAMHPNGHGLKQFLSRWGQEQWLAIDPGQCLGKPKEKRPRNS